MPLIQVTECRNDDVDNPGRHITVKGSDLMNSCENIVAKAVDYEKEKDYPAAIMFYKMAYDLNNEDCIFLHEIANCNFERGEFMKCLKQCNEAFLHPNATDKIKDKLALLKARAAYMAGDMWVAINTFEKVLRQYDEEDVAEVHLIFQDLVMEKEKLVQSSIEAQSIHPNWFPAEEHQLRLINTNADNDPVLTPIIDLAMEAEEKKKREELEKNLTSMADIKNKFKLSKPREVLLREYRK